MINHKFKLDTEKQPSLSNSLINSLLGIFNTLGRWNVLFLLINISWRLMFQKLRLEKFALLGWRHFRKLLGFSGLFFSRVESRRNQSRLLAFFLLPVKPYNRLPWFPTIFLTLKYNGATVQVFFPFKVFFTRIFTNCSKVMKYHWYKLWSKCFRLFACWAIKEPWVDIHLFLGSVVGWKLAVCVLFEILHIGV